MARVLVTGGSGLIGAALAEALVRRGDDVTCLVRRTSRTDHLAKLPVRLVYGDVTDRDAVAAAIERVDYVYHLAGLVKAFRAGELMRVNAEGVRHVAAACAKQANPPVLLYVSSLAAAGPAPPDRRLTEQDPAVPISNYGRSKRSGELAAEEFTGSIPITVVRPSMVIGEGDASWLPVFRSIDRYGLHLVTGVGQARYSPIHLADLVEATILAAEHGERLPAPADRNGNPGQGYYFVAGDEQPTYAELGRLVGDALGRSAVRVVHLPGPMAIYMAAALAEAVGRVKRRPSILNFDKVREVRAGSWTCSAEALRRRTGFTPGAPLVERLRQTAQWYRREKWL